MNINGFKKIAEVKVTSADFKYHVEAKFASCTTSIHVKEGKQFILDVRESVHEYAVGPGVHKYVAFHINFVHNCPHELIWGERHPYHEEGSIEVDALNLRACDGGGSHHKGDTVYQSMYYEICFDHEYDRYPTDDEVSDAVNALYTIVEPFLLNGKMDELQGSSMSPHYVFRDSAKFFWQEVDKQCDFSKYVTRRWGE